MNDKRIQPAETFVKRTHLDEAFADYQDAKYRLEERRHHMEAALLDCLDMTLREAIRSHLVRFNFPVSERLRRDIVNGNI